MNIHPIDANASYRVEEYTDDKAGAILRMVPITDEGVQDPLRTERFTGKTFLGTANGPAEVRFPLEASSLKEAFALWPAALQHVLDEMESKAVSQRIINGAKLSPSEARALKRQKQ